MCDENLPERVLASAAKAVEGIIPVKSKSVYEKEYSRFIQWTNDNSVKTVNETVLLAYFQELTADFSPNSLWTKFSMLRKELMVKKVVNSAKKFSQLEAYLKQRSKGYQPKKSKVLTREQVLTFLKNASDESFLMIKVALVMGVFGACRRDELVKMKRSDVRDMGEHILVNIPASKNDKPRSFMVIEDNEMDALRLIRSYISRRPLHETNDRFFLCLRGGRCTAQPVGKNTIGAIPSKIATFLGLPDAKSYTGHCLRRTAATLHADAGGSVLNLKQLGGWKSSTVAEGYVDDSECSKRKNARLVSGVNKSVIFQ